MPASIDIRNWARTKIVATLGPSSDTAEKISDLIRAGADVFRLNMAHSEPDEQQIKVDTIRRVSAELNRPTAILVDLAGPKIRLGEVDNDRIFCESGEEFWFVSEGSAAEPNELTSTYPPLIRELSVGDTVMLADGTVAMRVEEHLKECVRLSVIQRGDIRSRQGINLPGVKLSAPAISVDDHQHALWAAEAGVDFVSLSFVRAPDEVRALKDILRSSGSDAAVVSKIEKREALDRLEEVVAASDAVMVARGDLGVEIDVAEMPVEQKRIIHTCHRFQKPAIIATQMLDSMHDSLQPKRAEATDVANAVLDGADACMLSGETAIGQYPLETVRMMNRICLATERSLAHRPPKNDAVETDAVEHDVTRAIVRGAGEMAYNLGAKLVVVASYTGRTALALSQQRHFAPTIGVSGDEKTLRKMCLYWGVTPLAEAPAESMTGLVNHADAWSVANGLATKGDNIVIVGGSHLAGGSGEMTGGVHDVVLVHQVEGESIGRP
ncbi:MAG: pyruvate kinase [Planctomycetota bacterium]